MSLPFSLSDTVQPGGLVLALNDAETRLQLVLGRYLSSDAPESTGGEAAGRRKPPLREVLAAQEWTASARGAEILVPALEDMLNLLGLERCHLGRLAVVSGPGGFTGLRLTAMTAAALARGCRPEAPLPMAGMPYLSVLARNTLRKLGGFSGVSRLFPGMPTPGIAIITHARSDLVHAQIFEVNAGSATSGSFLAERSGIEVLSLEACVAWLRAYMNDRAVIVAGSGLTRHRAFFSEVCDAWDAGFPAEASGDLLVSKSLALLPSNFDVPSFYALYASALEAAYQQEDIEPLYVRASEAEENLPNLAPRLGLEAVDAQARLEALLRKDRLS